MRLQNSLSQIEPASVFAAFANHRKNNGSRAYPIELQTLACHLLDKGLSYVAVSEGCKIAKSSIFNWNAREKRRPQVRRLEVATQENNTSCNLSIKTPFVRIKLPSGIKLTLKRDDLNRQFLQTLLEVSSC